MVQGNDHVKASGRRCSLHTVGLTLAAAALISAPFTVHAESVGRQNFSAWKEPAERQAIRRKQNGPLQTDRGFFSSLFSFGRGRRLSEDEIRSRLSSSAPRKPAFFDYIPEPQVLLHDAKLEAEIEEGTPNFGVYELLKNGGTTPLRALKHEARAVRAFYAKNKFAPIWITKGSPNAHARGLLQLFSRADTDGLEPSVYLPSTLAGFEDIPTSLPKEDLARLELELTLAALTYSRHASSGQLVPNKIGRNFDIKTTPVAASTILSRLAAVEDPTTYLLDLHPAHPAYRLMKSELLRLRSEVNAAEEQVIVPAGKTLKLGMSGFSVKLLRARLTQLGFVRGAAPKFETSNMVDPSMDRFDLARQSADQNREPTSESYFDDDLLDALKEFQASRGLKQDGLAGRRTLAALNSRPASLEEKIRKLTIGMERMRWLPKNLGERHILVNKPEYMARVIDHGTTTHSMRVVVGKPRFPTAEFYDQMEHVVFNPYWNVPRSIAGNEMLPKLWSDPGYLDRAGYQVLDRRGRQVSSYSVDWSSYSGKTLPYSVRQPPGSGNALGAVKFMFPNKHAIYMHDTPAKKLFQRVSRAYSHGCVRVQTPRKFAQIVLGWDRARVDAAIGSGKNRRVELGKDIPVYLTYFTAWPDDRGNVRYHKDVYGRDAAMLKALKTLTRTAAQS